MHRNLKLLYITAQNLEEAESIGRKLVEEKLAACVNVIPSIQSIYRWQGKIEQTKEVVLIVKTHSSQIQSITNLVKDIHGYDCPCIIALSIDEDEGNINYLEWLKEESLDT